MTTTESYHRFLIKNRIWCEWSNGWKSCYQPATEVVNLNGRDEVRCREHAQRLKAARKSDKVQDLGLEEAQREATVPRIEIAS